jgi:hypothetical protein
VIDEQTFEQIAACVHAQAAGEATQAQLDALESLVLTDPDARRVYLTFVLETAELHRWATHAPRDLELDTTPPEVDMDFVLGILRASTPAEQPSATTSKPLSEPEPVLNALRYAAEGRHLMIPTWLVWAGLATAAVLALAFFWPTETQPPQPPLAKRTPPPAEQPDRTTPAKRAVVARVVEEVDAAWDITDTPMDADGSIFRGGVLRLDQGLAKLMFANGAEVILEAPVSVRIRNHNQINLVRGKLVAYCPATAHNFTVQTQSLQIIDLGTEFGVEVSSEGEVDAQVFTGEIEVQIDHASATKRPDAHHLTNGMAVRHDPSVGGVVHAPAQPQRFVRDNEFQARVLAEEGSAYHRWLAASHELRRDPDLVLYYTFDRQADKPRRLKNASAVGEELDGWLGLTGELPKWVDGRFPKKSALRIDNAEPLDPKQLQGGRIPHSPKLNLQDQFTLLAWIRTPAEEVHGGGPIVSYRDAPMANIGFQLGVYFPEQARNRPSIQFASGNEKAANPHSRAFQSFSTTRLGNESWHQLVLVYSDQKAAFYIDGELAHEAEDVLPPQLTGENTPMLIGAAPWPMSENSGEQERAAGYVGDIDELAIFRRGLTGREIAELYKQGKPENAAEDTATNSAEPKHNP